MLAHAFSLYLPPPPVLHCHVSTLFQERLARYSYLFSLISSLSPSLWLGPYTVDCRLVVPNNLTELCELEQTRKSSQGLENNKKTANVRCRLSNFVPPHKPSRQTQQVIAISVLQEDALLILSNRETGWGKSQQTMGSLTGWCREIFITVKMFSGLIFLRFWRENMSLFFFGGGGEPGNIHA